jgi:glucose-6-phosphate isomerase
MTNKQKVKYVTIINKDGVKIEMTYKIYKRLKKYEKWLNSINMEVDNDE